MSAGAHEFLYESLAATFEGATSDVGSRRAVLVLGAGLHHFLRRRAEKPDDEFWQLLTNWNGLLASMARKFEIPVVEHQDPVATWESLVARATYRHRVEGTTEKNMSGIENLALRELAKSLQSVPMSNTVLEQLGQGLTRYRDVISLNIDDACWNAAVAVGAQPSAVGAQPSAVSSKELGLLTPSRSWTLKSAEGRLWQPHGSCTRPTDIVLGSRAYGKSLSKLSDAWVNAKASEKIWGKAAVGQWTPELAREWWNARRAVPPLEDFEGKTRLLTWLDLFLGSDLVFIGTSLDRAETDLWSALHMRQRNLARVPPSVRPRAFVLFEKQVPEHLRTGPAGITPVVFSSWDEAWNMVLGVASA